MAAAVHAIDLWKSYPSSGDEVSVLRGLDLEINAGGAVAITGASGSGKSTLLNLVAGLDRFRSGRLQVGDLELSDLNETELSRYRQSLGVIFQFHHLLRDFNVRENLSLTAQIRGHQHLEIQNRVDYLLTAVGLQDRASHFPSELSGGERQRVAVARALSADPLLVLADEPTGNLDEKNSMIVADLLFEIVRKQAVTLILVTHDLALAARADSVYQLASGVLKAV